MNLRDEWRERVAEVVAAHRVNYHHRNVGPEPVTADNLRYTSCEGCDWLGGHRDEAGWESHLADQLLAPGGVVAGIVAEAEIAGQMKHITAEVARGDVSLSESEEIIAALRARVSHAEAERDEAFRRAPNMGAAVYERGKRDGAADVRARVEAVLPNSSAIRDEHWAMEERGEDCGCSYKDCYECGKWHSCSHGTTGLADDVREALKTAQNPPSGGRTGSGEGAGTSDGAEGVERGEG